MPDKGTYPFYRKYPDDRAWFKIISIDEFEELKISGKYFSLNIYKASILPDRNFIYDLTYSDIGKQVTETEYNNQVQFCFNNLTKVDF